MSVCLLATAIPFIRLDRHAVMPFEGSINGSLQTHETERKRERIWIEKPSSRVQKSSIDLCIRITLWNARDGIRIRFLIARYRSSREIMSIYLFPDDLATCESSTKYIIKCRIFFISMKKVEKMFSYDSWKIKITKRLIF